MGLAHALYTCPAATCGMGRAQGSEARAEEAARLPTATIRDHMRTLKSTLVCQEGAGSGYGYCMRINVWSVASGERGWGLTAFRRQETPSLVE